MVAATLPGQDPVYRASTVVGAAMGNRNFGSGDGAPTRGPLPGRHPSRSRVRSAERTHGSHDQRLGAKPDAPRREMRRLADHGPTTTATVRAAPYPEATSA